MNDSETNTNVSENEYKKEIIFTFRLTSDQARDMYKLMKVMGISKVSKFIRKMLKVMIKNGKEKGII